MSPVNINLNCDSDCKKWCPRTLKVKCCCCCASSPDVDEPVEQKEHIVQREEVAVKVDSVADKMIKNKNCIVC